MWKIRKTVFCVCVVVFQSDLESKYLFNFQESFNRRLMLEQQNDHA